jgi:hypothetical protein
MPHRRSRLLRPGLTPAETGFAGCGALVLAVVICAGVAIYYAKRNISMADSSDPVQLRAWLQEEVVCDLPKGYDVVRGLKVNALGSSLLTLFIAQPGAVKGEHDDFDPQKTVFMVMRAPMVDQAEPTVNDGSRSVTKADKVEMKVSGKKVKVDRRETTANHGARVEYQVPLRRGLIFLGFGPADKFDLPAAEALLGSMVLDRPGDLPSAVPASEPPRKVPN